MHHDRLAVHEFVHRWWFLYDEGHLDALAGLLTEDCHVRSRTERGDHPHEVFIAGDNHGPADVMAWKRQHRAASPYPLRHNATNVFVAAERGDEVDVESYLLVTLVVDRKPSPLSSAIVRWTLVRTPAGYRLRFQDTVLDSIASAPFSTIPEVSGRMALW